MMLDDLTRFDTTHTGIEPDQLALKVKANQNKIYCEQVSFQKETDANYQVNVCLKHTLRWPILWYFSS